MALTTSAQARTSFDLKSASLPVVAVVLKTTDAALFAADLADRVADAPGFFDNDPVLLDLAPVRDAEEPIDFAAIVAMLRSHSTLPVAVRGGSAAQMEAARAAGLAAAPDAPPARAEAPPAPAEVREVVREVEVEVVREVPVAGPGTMVIDKPLRSGQQVYARGGDLVVMAVVSFGAEVIADGNIHVYAPLRGRAIAGARGNTEARIFSTCMEPQLVSSGWQAGPSAAGGRKAHHRAAAQSCSYQPQRELIKPMAKIVVVTSGKGGVGKTTTSASFATGLALRGHKTAVIDFDVGLRNLDLIMGCERRVVYDLINVIQGEANLNQALIKDKQCDNLFVLAASQTRDKDALTQDGVEKVLKDLAAMDFEYIVCDSPAGIESGALMAMHFADEALLVTNPVVSSVRDSDRILGMLGSKTKRAIEGGEPIKEHLLITRYNPSRVEDGQMLSLEDIQDILRIKLIGVIPESEVVLQSSNQGTPAIHAKDTDVSEAYKDVIDRFLGATDKPLRFIEAEKPGFFKRLFGSK